MSSESPRVEISLNRVSDEELLNALIDFPSGTSDGNVVSPQSVGGSEQSTEPHVTESFEEPKISRIPLLPLDSFLSASKSLSNSVSGTSGLPQATQIGSNLRSARSSNDSPMASARSSAPRSLPELLTHFWELSFTLFLNVCAPTSTCDDALSVVEDMSRIVKLCNSMQSPALMIALDIIVQRAMYELSDKLSKTTVSQGSESIPCDSAQNIERCVSLMSSLVLPLCNSKQRELSLDILHDSPMALGYKTQTLNRQLQELVAWTSIEGQSTAPTTFEPSLSDSLPSLAGKLAGNGQIIDSARISPRVAGEMPLSARSQHSQPQPPLSLHVDSQQGQQCLDAIDRVLFSTLMESGTKAKMMHNMTGGNHNHEGNNQSISPQFVDSLKQSLLNVVSVQMNSAAADIFTCGSFLLGTSIGETPQLDLVVLSATSIQRVQQWQTGVSSELSSNTIEIAQQNAQSHGESWLDSAIKHVRACAKDFAQQCSDLAVQLQQHAQRCNNPFLLRTASMLDDESSAMRMAVEARLSFVESLLWTAKRRRSELSAVSTPGLNGGVTIEISTPRDELETNIHNKEKDERERSVLLRRLAKSLEKPLRDAGFAQVRCITNRTRFVHLSFIACDARTRTNVPCALILDSEQAVQSTLMLQEFIARDESNKLRVFLAVIKRFAAAHKISDASGGYLSPFAWQCMAIHVLLRFGLIKNLPRFSEHDSDEATSILPESDKSEANSRYRPTLESLHLFELLDIFFRYYVQQFDCFSQVASLRGKALPLRKSQWTKNPVLWRLSIEDPCAPPIGNTQAVDLGSSLSRPGQLTTFKVLRRAVYGIRSIIAFGVDASRSNIGVFFSRSELIHLARRSDYVGATISPPATWAGSCRTIDQVLEPVIDEDPEKFKAIIGGRLSLSSVLPIRELLVLRNELQANGSCPPYGLSERDDSMPNTGRSYLSQLSPSTSLNASPRLPFYFNNQTNAQQSLGQQSQPMTSSFNLTPREADENPIANFASGMSLNTNSSGGMKNSSSGSVADVANDGNLSSNGSSKRPVVPLIPLQSLSASHAAQHATTLSGRLLYPNGNANNMSNTNTNSWTSSQPTPLIVSQREAGGNSGPSTARSDCSANSQIESNQQMNSKNAQQAFRGLNTNYNNNITTTTKPSRFPTGGLSLSLAATGDGEYSARSAVSLSISSGAEFESQQLNSARSLTDSGFPMSYGNNMSESSAEHGSFSEHQMGYNNTAYSNHGYSNAFPKNAQYHSSYRGMNTNSNSSMGQVAAAQYGQQPMQQQQLNRRPATVHNPASPNYGNSVSNTSTNGGGGYGVYNRYPGNDGSFGSPHMNVPSFGSSNQHSGNYSAHHNQQQTFQVDSGRKQLVHQQSSGYPARQAFVPDQVGHNSHYNLNNGPSASQGGNYSAADQYSTLGNNAVNRAAFSPHVNQPTDAFNSSPHLANTSPQQHYSQNTQQKYHNNNNNKNNSRQAQAWTNAFQTSPRMQNMPQSQHLQSYHHQQQQSQNDQQPFRW